MEECISCGAESYRIVRGVGMVNREQESLYLEQTKEVIGLHNT